MFLSQKQERMKWTEFDKQMARMFPTDPLVDELKAAAFEVLLLNPGSEQSDWAQILVEQYGTEVVDAYGNDPNEVYADLADLWESPYYDERSGLEYTFEEWAQALYTEQSVQMYHELTKVRET